MLAIPKTTMIAAITALLAASPMALAAQTATPTTTSATHAGVTANRIEPGQIRATDLKGSTVYDARNQEVGRIDDLVLDHDGRVAAVVLDVGGKNVAVHMSDLKFAMDQNKKPKITVAMSNTELGSAAPFQLNRTTAGSGGSTAPTTTAPTTPSR